MNDEKLAGQHLAIVAAIQGLMNATGAGSSVRDSVTLHKVTAPMSLKSNAEFIAGINEVLQNLGLDPLD
ncbi:hypothetical protein V3390_00275 [Luteimonas sp. FXH3W]|uniref:Uncharacterized protein n=1 Tax=Aquilutibacter rugosus TaxID=3115820 RepID=A0ABU7UXJ5_9GAMM